MQPTFQSITLTEPRPRRHILLKIIVVIVVLVIIAGATVLIIRGVHQGNLENEVKTELIKQNKLIKSVAKKDVYPATLPEGVKTTDKVIIGATVSMNGTSYCIAGTSKTDGKIVYHMDKSTPETEPAKGACSDDATVVPSVPSGIAVGSVGAGVVNLEWNEAPYAASYTAQCATDSAFTTGLKSKTISGLTATIDGLDGDAHYYCRVAASNSLGQSAWSAILDAVPTLVSVAPAELTVLTVSRSELKYTWNPVAGASSYILEYSPDIGFTKAVVSITTSVTSGSIKGLKTYTAYYFHVKAVTSGFDASSAAFSGMVLGRTAE